MSKREMLESKITEILRAGREAGKGIRDCWELIQQVERETYQEEEEEFRNGIRAFGGDPDSKEFDDWDIRDLAMLGEVARQIKNAYGVQLIVKPKIQTREPGRRKHEGYNRAFARIYITQECKPVEAFELYLAEEGIETRDEGERAAVWEAFNTAIKRRRRAAR